MSEISITITAKDLTDALLAVANALSALNPSLPTLSNSVTPVSHPTAVPTQGVDQQIATQQNLAGQRTIPTLPLTTASGIPVNPASSLPTGAVAPNPSPNPAAIVPTTQPTYTADQLALAASSLVDAGRMDEIRGLLHQFGVLALTQLPPEQYGAFAIALRQMGAKL